MPEPVRANGSKRRLGFAAATVVVVVLLAACRPPAPDVGPASSAESIGPGPPIEQVVFDRVNFDRVAHGLAPLRWNVQLADLARDHTTTMAATGDFSHRDLGATIRLPYFAGYAWLGENILLGPRALSGAAMEDAWMRSPDHRANILSPNFDSVGIAVGWGADGRVWATQDFGGNRR